MQVLQKLESTTARAREEGTPQDDASREEGERADGATTRHMDEPELRAAVESVITDRAEAGR